MVLEESAEPTSSSLDPTDKSGAVQIAQEEVYGFNTLASQRSSHGQS